MHTLSLNEHFIVKETPLSCHSPFEARLQPTVSEVTLPCDVHMALMQAGRIKDPTLADYCKDIGWIEHRAWWFFRTFDRAELPQGEVIELELSWLDTHAEIFLNGIEIGTNDSVHIPFVRDLSRYLQDGINELAVRMTTGLENVSDRDLAELNFACTQEPPIEPFPRRGDFRRSFVRRPQYSTGWDWAPRIATCGMNGSAAIHGMQGAAIRALTVSTVSANAQQAVLRVTAEIWSPDIAGTREGALAFCLKTPDDQIAAEYAQDDLLLTSGTNFVDFTVTVKAPQLWWPNGSGAQPLYTAVCTVTTENGGDTASRRVGIRTLRLVTDKHGSQRYFHFEINGTAIFCKGGDWIPPDHLYARAGAAQLRRLIEHAKNANFNMLRIWGGGIYERDAFYDACDESGILIWHDFMFGCSTYPDHRPLFRWLVEQELRYQTTRLATHPCMALWCGNNEDHWIFYNDRLPYDNDRQFGLLTANDLCVRAVRAHCPHIPYWNSSPYGGTHPNDDTCGDVHHWHACFMNPDMEKRINPFAYDELPASFVSEYGYIGPCCAETMRQYFDGAPIDMNSDIWRLHTNTFEKKTVAAGVLKHYGRPSTDMETYIYDAGMVQSMMYNYSLEALRSKPACGGALFWMYNDTWGETGWTIVDAFLRRKPGYYGVKRAFAPIRLILRRAENNIVITGCNETAEDLSLSVQLGLFALDGSANDLTALLLQLPARSRGTVYTLPLPNADWTRYVFAVLPQDSRVAPAFLRMTETAHQALSAPRLSVTCRTDRDDLVLTLTSENYIHGLTIDTDGDPEDSGFDLLPHETRTVRIVGTHTLPCLRIYFPTRWEFTPEIQA